MDYRYLGRTDLKVSELYLVTMTFGREAPEELSRQMMDRFVEAGGNFLDTVDVYTQGVSEEIVAPNKLQMVSVASLVKRDCI